MTFNLKDYLKQKKTLVDQALLKALPAKDCFPKKVHEAMHYSLFAGGKRIRPVLCFAAAEACGGTALDVMPIACALEMIHTFSLIHDDLPAMDDDSLRRGVPTNHIVFGEAIAILAGDALHAQAFVALGQLAKSSFDAKMVLEIGADIADATGSLGMVGGQIVDLESEGKKISLDELKTLHRLKTGRLIAVSITSGAKLVCQDKKKIEALAVYGEAVGLAFQIADDILDIEGGVELGKDIGSDIANGKATYPALMGLDGAKAEAQRVCRLAIDALKMFGDEAIPLREIATYIVNRKS